MPPVHDEQTPVAASHVDECELHKHGEHASTAPRDWNPAPQPTQAPPLRRVPAGQAVQLTARAAVTEMWPTAQLTQEEPSWYLGEVHAVQAPSVALPCAAKQTNPNSEETRRQAFREARGGSGERAVRTE